MALREPTRPHFEKFTLPEMQAVHKHSLEGVYEWAGKIRTYTTGRNVASFARPEYIESYFETAVLKPLQRESYLKGTSREQFAERGAHFACEVNAIHPFIDGNGRVTRLFLQDLASQAGYKFDIARVEANKGAWYEAMKVGFERGDTAKLKQEILNALSSEKAIDSEKEKSANKRMAESFVKESPEKAVQQHPELAGAATATAAMEKKVQVDGLSAKECAVVMARVREHIANSIGCGDTPEMKIREEKKIENEPPRGPEQ